MRWAPAAFVRRIALTTVLVVAGAISPAVSASGSPSPPFVPSSTDLEAGPLAPVAVALDPTLVRPQPGDSAATLSARTILATAQHSYAAANQRYDKAAAAAEQAQLSLQSAQLVAQVARAASDQARGELASVAVSIYEAASPVPASIAVLLTSSGDASVLDDLARQGQIAGYQAQQVQEAVSAQSAADRAQAQLEAAQTLASQTEADAVAAERGAATLVANAQRAVGALHIKDLEVAAAAAAARAREAGSRTATGLDNAAAAAAALQAQALASGAATARTFPARTTVIGTIALAARALIRKAATTGTDVRDEQAVMGPADLGGSVPWVGATGSGPSVGLTVFDGRASTSNWPNAGVGTKVPGTAPFLPPDGVNVHPVLPKYPKRYRPLRAQIAVDAALEQLGSPYVWDAAGATTFDCSGLMLWAWGHAGVTLQHFTGTQVQEGMRVDPTELLPGDLVLFGAQLHHVGMYLGAGYMIDAPDTGDYVKIQLVSDMGDFAVAVRP